MENIKAYLKSKYNLTISVFFVQNRQNGIKFHQIIEISFAKIRRLCYTVVCIRMDVSIGIARPPDDTRNDAQSI